MSSFSKAVMIIGEKKIFHMPVNKIVDILIHNNFTNKNILEALEDLHYFENLNSYCENREPKQKWLSEIHKYIKYLDDLIFNEEELFYSDFLDEENDDIFDKNDDNIWYNHDDISNNEELVKSINSIID
jgi:hypothetical protein